MVRVLLVFLILSVFSQESCLRKQSLTVEPPVWPRYRFDGQVFDSLSLLPVDSAFVTLSPIFLIFPDSFQKETAWTDSNGFFTFDSIPAMFCALYIDKSGFEEFEKNFVIQRDRNIAIYLTPR